MLPVVASEPGSHDCIARTSRDPSECPAGGITSFLALSLPLASSWKAYKDHHNVLSHLLGQG